jgi:hypothetical protein
MPHRDWNQQAATDCAYVATKRERSSSRMYGGSPLREERHERKSGAAGLLFDLSKFLSKPMIISSMRFTVCVSVNALHRLCLGCNPPGQQPIRSIFF